MSERKPKADGGTLDVKTMDALLEARSKPPGPERTEALIRADKLRHTADTYNYLVSAELKPPE